MAQFGSRTVAPASRSHFQIFYSDIYLDFWKPGQREFYLFEVVLILRLSLKDTVSKLRSKEVFLFMSAVFLHLLQQLVAWKGEAKKNKCKRKETPKEVGWFLTQKLSRNCDFCACLRFGSLKLIFKCKTWRFRAVDNILGQWTQE